MISYGRAQIAAAVMTEVFYGGVLHLVDVWRPEHCERQPMRALQPGKAPRHGQFAVRKNANQRKQKRDKGEIQRHQAQESGNVKTGDAANLRAAGDPACGRRTETRSA